jgi:hypothetical protein
MNSIVLYSLNILHNARHFIIKIQKSFKNVDLRQLKTNINHEYIQKKFF